MIDKPIPNRIFIAKSIVMVSCESSCPPLKPIEKRRYKDINFEELDGMAKSLLAITEKMPSKKQQRRVGEIFKQ